MLADPRCVGAPQARSNEGEGGETRGERDRGALPSVPRASRALPWQADLRVRASARPARPEALYLSVSDR